VNNFVKMISDAKSFFGKLVNKADGTVIYFNSVYCYNCLAKSALKVHEDIFSTKICHNILNVW